ncbi:Zinc finger protein [Plecturocebus cupreus]
MCPNESKANSLTTSMVLRKRAALYQTVFDKRSEVIDSICKPTDEWPELEIISSFGWKIYWKKGNSVTVEMIKWQQCEGHGTVVKTSREESLNISMKSGMKRSKELQAGRKRTRKRKGCEKQGKLTPKAQQREAEEIQIPVRIYNTYYSKVCYLKSIHTQNFFNSPLPPIPKISAHLEAISLATVCCDHDSLQPPPLGSSNPRTSASPVPGNISACHHTWLFFVFLVKTEFQHVAQADLELLSSKQFSCLGLPECWD